MGIPEGYDPETLEYVGPCPRCGTDHSHAGGPETLGGQYACLGMQIKQAGWVARMVYGPRWRSLGRWVEAKRVEAITRMLRS